MHLSLAMEFLTKQFGTTKEILESMSNDVKKTVKDDTKQYIEDAAISIKKFGYN
jgi:hypothetical protein